MQSLVSAKALSARLICRDGNTASRKSDDDENIESTEQAQNKKSVRTRFYTAKRELQIHISDSL